MANRKISDLTALTTPATGDLLPIVDISEAAAADKNKRITIEKLFQGIPVNVGIGATSPAGLIHGRAAAGAVGLLLDGNTGDSNTSPPVIDFRGSAGSGQGARIAAINTGAGFGRLDLAFFTSNTGSDTYTPAERARIDSSGRLLVGTSSARTFFSGGVGDPRIQQDAASFATAGFSLFSSSNGTTESNYLAFGRARGGSLGSSTIVNSDDTLGFISFCGSDGGTNHQAARIDAFVDGTPGVNDMPGRLVFSTTADGAASPTERMRIGQNGKIYLNTTTEPGSNDSVLTIKASSGTKARCLALETNDTANIIIQTFYNPNGAVGTITTSGSSTAYNTSSDYRLKENVTPITNGITRFKQLKPSQFNFLADPDHTVDGFIAHEAQAVVPECVTGTKDAVDADGNPVFQGIDQSKLVPLLTAALQEAIAKIESLETRLSALEGA